jgi:MFS family permease
MADPASKENTMNRYRPPASRAIARDPIFYGWWMVMACLVIATLGWSLGLFGASVYLHEISQARGWSIALISSAVTSCLLIGAVSSVFVGSAIAEYGPRWVIVFGALTLAAGVAGMGEVRTPWQVYAAFSLIGLSWACLSTTAITTTLAPWFEHYQGRAVSTALLGASIGGMIGAPSLLLVIGRFGFTAAMLTAAAIALIVLLPLALLVLKRRPEDIGLQPDGAVRSGHILLAEQRLWSRRDALRTAMFWSVVLAFGFGLMVQIGFISHHVSLVAPVAGTAGASAAVSGAAIAAFLGRLALARYSDRIDIRLTSAAVLLLATSALCVMALMPTAAALLAASVVFGLTIGNLTTLSPLIVRREFGAVSFGAVYGLASTCIGLISGLGPSFYGLLHDISGGYRLPLLIAAAIDLFSAAAVTLGGRVPLTLPPIMTLGRRRTTVSSRLRRRKRMLELRPNCECCNKDLPPTADDAMICTFECTFCSECTETKLNNVCPNCGGDLQRRPIRPASKLDKFPASTKRVMKPEGCAPIGTAAA